jgi:hypothetical protein
LNLIQHNIVTDELEQDAFDLIHAEVTIVEREDPRGLPPKSLTCPPGSGADTRSLCGGFVHHGTPRGLAAAPIVSNNKEEM